MGHSGWMVVLVEGDVLLFLPGLPASLGVSRGLPAFGGSGSLLGDERGPLLVPRVTILFLYLHLQHRK